MLVLSRARWHFAAIVCSIVLVSACTDNPTPLTGPPVGAAVLSVGATPGFRFASASHSNSTPPSGIETNAGEPSLARWRWPCRIRLSDKN